MEPTADVPEAAIALLAVVKPGIDFIPQAIPIEAARIGERDSVVPFPIDGIFRRVECDFHSDIVVTESLNFKDFL
jgi:hypothetical protein